MRELCSIAAPFGNPALTPDHRVTYADDRSAVGTDAES
jgi:hypothetical protein